ncbi:uncharacterized protein LOC109792186 [Cajanus cajan]|uniref:uncharacterized protein LOC109792186 n=1 Tax=Cajanus cajan TaxID=3821 RepID=UPI00098D9B14|nr:uncharacterized protein LOC109792186 [Cajanus cajan]
MERFANIVIKIRNLNPEVALHAMLIELKPGPFIDSLYRRPPPDMDELRARAARYIQMKEHTTFRDQVRGKPQGRQDHGHKDKMRVSNDSQFKKTRLNKGKKYDFYTPLNTRVHILEEASNTDLITLTPPGHNPSSVDKSKHCRYQRNYGHTTKECRTLRDHIEELVLGGHLGQYIQRQQGHKAGYNRRGRGTTPISKQPTYPAKKAHQSCPADRPS